MRIIFWTIIIGVYIVCSVYSEKLYKFAKNFTCFVIVLVLFVVVSTFFGFQREADYFLGKCFDAIDVIDSIAGKSGMFIYAIKNGDTGKVERMLSEDVRLLRERGNTPLMTAIYRNRKDVAELLLARGAAVNVRYGRNGSETPLIAAIRNEDVVMMDLLFKNGAEADYPNGYWQTPLMVAIQGIERCAECMELLLMNDPTIMIDNKHHVRFFEEDRRRSNPGNKYRGTIRVRNEFESAKLKITDFAIRELLRAIKNGDTVTVKRMISEDKSLIGQESNNETPLVAAVSFNRKEIAELLITQGADVRAKGDRYDRTPLIAASYKGHTEMIGLLLKHGAGIEERDGRGYTALMEAAHGGSTKCIGILLDSGANIDSARRYFPKTALEFAVRFGNADCVGYLLERGAKADHTDLVRVAQVFLGKLHASDGVRINSYGNVIRILNDYKSGLIRKQ